MLQKRLRRARFAIVCTLLSVATSTAAEARQFLLGARAGITAPVEDELPAGPLVGLDATMTLHRLVAAELQLEQSFHWPERQNSRPLSLLTGLTLGLQYRLDVTKVATPYVTVAFEAVRTAVSSDTPQLSYGAAVAVGALFPIGKSMFLGGEARYGVGADGSFPHRQTYVLRLGWRSADF